MWLTAFLMLSDTQHNMLWRLSSEGDCDVQKVGTWAPSQWHTAELDLKKNPEQTCCYCYQSDHVALPVSPSATITSTRCQTSQHHTNPTLALTSTSADTAGVQTQVSVGDMWGSGLLSLCFSLVFRRLDWLGHRLRRASRSRTTALAGGKAALEISAEAAAPPRDLFPLLSRFAFFSLFAFSSHRRQTFRISWGISSCRNRCHIPKVPWLLMPRSGLLSPLLLPAAGGQEGGATGFVRSSGACVARTVRSLDSPVITRQSASYLKYNRRWDWLKGCNPHTQER